MATISNSAATVVTRLGDINTRKSPSGLLVHWFRRGLRLHDNPAFRDGLLEAATFRCIYILDPYYAGVGVNKWRFLLQSLKDLDTSLRKWNSRLFVIRGQPADVFPKLIEGNPDFHSEKECYTVPSLEDLGFDQEDIQSNNPCWLGGETEALARRQRYIDRKGGTARTRSMARGHLILDWMNYNHSLTGDLLLFLAMSDVELNNDVNVIRRNPKVTSVNSCIEVDITGQVVSDSLGDTFFSGHGGQIDFVRGATLCDDGKGKAVICMTSLAHNGSSKIVSMIKTGSGVVTTRAHVNYLVTEYGIAQLFGKNFRQRAYELINIAHPSVRETLEKEAYERFHVMPSPD